MAAMTLRSTGAKPLMRTEHPLTKTRYTLRSDGKILRQWRYSDGKLSNATVSHSFANHTDAARLMENFRRFAAKMAPDGTVEVLA